MKLIITALIVLLLVGCSTPSKQSCEAWRDDAYINSPVSSTPPSGATHHTCPSGEVCTDSNSRGTWELTFGHSEDNPANGFCSAAFGFSD